VSFSTGYWHASPPTPLRIAPGTLAEWRKLGMPTDIEAPRGGRAMLIGSTDDGRTWSKPQTIIDTPWDDRSPAIVELPDGTLVASFFTYSGGDFRKEPELAHRTVIIRSRDGGKTWEQTPRQLPSPFAADATDGPPVVLKDGSVLLAVYGSPKEGGPEQVGVFRSTDAGQTWQLLSVVKSNHEMSETGLAQLPDGRLVMISRPEGDITWSSDGGRTWTKPVTFGMRMYEPGLLVLRDGMLLCLHGSYGAGGFRAIFSADGGETWTAPARNHGFAVDPSVYGYGRGIELPDGSVLAVYIHTGGHTTKDAKTEALWAIRLRVRPDRAGLDLLPATERAGQPIPSVQALADSLSCTADFFDVDGCPAFLIRPKGKVVSGPMPWVWYAPVIGHPNPSHAWMLRQWLDKGIGMAGVDVGESFGSPRGRAVYTHLWETLRTRYRMSDRPCLLPQSRGGLMLYNWAAENPDRVGCIAGIYTVCDLRSYPGIERACGAYGLKAAELQNRLAEHNPIERLAPLAKAGVPILHVHGDADAVVPLENNSGELTRRYRALGGSMRLIVIPGKGHQVCPEFFQCQELVDFVIAQANVSGGAGR
jgi:pimeloyl-ACP methyl ester carboxylesterase